MSAPIGLLDDLMPSPGVVPTYTGTAPVPGVCECGDRISPPRQDEDTPHQVAYRLDGSPRGTCGCFRRRARCNHQLHPARKDEA